MSSYNERRTSDNDWYDYWQQSEHAANFDQRHSFGRRSLFRSYDSLNDVRLLRQAVPEGTTATLVEVGCATGEFQRYLGLRYPGLRYFGIDISASAINRAKDKYPAASLFVTNPGTPLSESLVQVGITEPPQFVYSKDVVHHQTNPFEFAADLLGEASEALVFRTRTRDTGDTELDPAHSCQYHYGGWMPYIVLNLDELIEELKRGAPGAELVVYRNHKTLGGQFRRFLPKDCYLPETGTAETAIAVLRNTEAPGTVTIRDVAEASERSTVRLLADTLTHRLSAVRRRF